MDEIAQEVIVLWCLTGAAVAIMIVRVVLRKYRKQKLEWGDYLTMAAILALLLRSSVIHVALVWGTNSINAAARKQINFTAEEIYRREVGSKLTIVNRVFYTVYTWLQKCVIMFVLQRLLEGLQSPTIIRMYWASLAITFVVSLVATFVDCRPFQLYWQVVPNPGTCSKGNIQLIVFSTLNMVTDVMLIALPLPHLIKIRRPFWSKIRLMILFLVGLTIVAVTLTRLLMNIVLFNRAGQSHNVANVELFFEAFVANAPTIYGLLRIESRIPSKIDHQSNLPSAWTESKSANSNVHYLVTESDRRQPGSIRHENESDEEMMIELSEGSSTVNLHPVIKSET